MEFIPNNTQMHLAACNALNYIPPNSKIVAFGAGRTVLHALKAFFDLGLYNRYSVYCASDASFEFAKSLGMKLASHADIQNQNFCYIDGADQIDTKFNLIKGGPKNTGNPGIEGCQLKEKELANKSSLFIVIADDSKVVEFLGVKNYPIPIEIDIAQMENIVSELSVIFKNKLISDENLRKYNSKIFKTENAKHILDVPFDSNKFQDLPYIENKIMSINGVISTGIVSIRKPDIVVISYAHRLKTHYNTKNN